MVENNRMRPFATFSQCPPHHSIAPLPTSAVECPGVQSRRRIRHLRGSPERTGGRKRFFFSLPTLPLSCLPNLPLKYRARVVRGWDGNETRSMPREGSQHRKMHSRHTPMYSEAKTNSESIGKSDESDGYQPDHCTGENRNDPKFSNSTAEEFQEYSKPKLFCILYPMRISKKAFQ
ncbi:hypothetical protein NPIL_698721 [Nephila pilipes]|uniref:Uncharacterized protein n=1 Tax=Nephila pilipes TaxID=299642 RepID=A0A8X6U5K3_NEPPI|nr:hypothetical protein NPIL_698721 [Nephila pilipes]